MQTEGEWVNKCIEMCIYKYNIHRASLMLTASGRLISKTQVLHFIIIVPLDGNFSDAINLFHISKHAILTVGKCNRGQSLRV